MTITITEKKCPKCKRTLSVDQFHKNAASYCGLQTYCKDCFRIVEREDYQRNKEKRRASVRIYQSKNRQKCNERARLYRMKDPAKHRECVKRSQRKLRYGITHAEYQKMTSAQGGLCAICEQPDRYGKSLCVDHDHATGVSRELLCHDCNRALGFAKDDTRILSSMIRYIEKHQQKGVAAQKPEA